MDEIEEIKERYPVGILLILCHKGMVRVEPHGMVRGSVPYLYDISIHYVHV